MEKQTFSINTDSKCTCTSTYKLIQPDYVSFFLIHPFLLTAPHIYAHTNIHTHTETFPFALWARQQLCLVQVEEQLMNQTERLTIHIC